MGGGTVPLPGSSSSVPLPGMGGGGVPLPGSSSAVPLPGMGGGVPLPGASSGVPLPGMGAGVPLPGMGAGVPLPGMGGGVPLPGVSSTPLAVPPPKASSLADIFDDADLPAPMPSSPPPASKPSLSMSDIFGDDSANDAPLPTPFHGNNSVVVSTGGAAGLNTLLDFIDDAGKADGAPKQEQYRIRKRSGRVLGPFDVQTVLQMFARGELLGSEEASTDGVTWRTLAQIPAFSETIQKAMASALGGLEDLPVPRGAEKKPTAKDELAVGTGDLLKAEKAKEQVERRRREAESRRGTKLMAAMAVGVVAVVVVVIGVAAEFATPYGWFFVNVWNPSPTEAPALGPTIAVVETPPPPPSYGDEVPAADLLRRDTYAAYRQGAEQARRVVDSRKSVSPFPEDGRKAAAEQAHFLAYLTIVEDMPAFLPELQGALALAGGDEIGVTIGKTAVAYATQKWDEGLALMAPLADPARSLSGPQLAEVDVWLALGHRGKGDLDGAMKQLDSALQADMGSLVALSHMAQVASLSGDPEAATHFMDKVFALSPAHPRSRILKGTLLAASSETLAEGKEILLDMSEGKGAEAASPAQRANAYIERAQVAISARAFPEAMRLLGAAVALVPQNRTFRIRAVDFAIRLREYTVAREHAKALLELNPKDPAGIVALARARMGTKDNLGAYTDLQLALKTNPDDATLNFWFGVAAKEMGKLQEARAQFEKAQKLDPKAADPVVENIIDAIERGKLSDALKMADAAIEQVNTGERHRVRAVKAYVYARRRQFPEAVAEYVRALNENPRDSDARARYAEALVGMKNLAEAEKQVSEAMLMDGKNPAVLLAAGDVAKARGELKQALDRYEEAMQLAPSAHEPYVRAAIVAARLKDPQRARGLAETAGQLRPNNPDVIVAQALVVGVNDPKQASTLLTQAAEAAPEDPQLPFLLGDIYMQMGGQLEAVDALRRAVTLAPAFDDAWYLLGKVNRELGRNDEAKRCFTEVTKLDKTRSDAWVAIADILATTGDDAGALDAYQKALRAEPNNPASVCAMGETLVLRMGEDAKNLKHGAETLERCVRLNKVHPSAWKNLGNAYKTMNKRKEAVVAYKQHLAVVPDDPENGIIRDFIVDLGGKVD
jgi:tetratricopeptide (TPR) repeat protein